MTTSQQKRKRFLNSYEVQLKRIRECAESARRNFANHTIRQQLNQGVFRSWICQRQDSWIYGFCIHTTPGTLIVTGDIGELIVRRTYDMLPWSRSAIRDCDYFAEKVPHSIKTREYDPDVARALIHEFYAELKDNYDRDGRRKILEGLDEKGYSRNQLLWSCECEHEFYRAVLDTGIFDGADFPDPTNWNSNFLWCREAVKWFLERECQDYQI